MPTGYTAAIADGISFRDFALRCARAFGALVTMRDDPMDAPIHDFVPADYHSKALAKARTRLAELNRMTLDGAEQAAQEEYDEAARSRAESIAKDRALSEAYGAMRRQVEAWNPPTADHVGLKDFMLKQIDESIRFDSMADYYRENPIKRIQAAEWLEKQRTSAMWDIEYHAKEHAAEVARVESRNAWVEALRESLP